MIDDTDATVTLVPLRELLDLARVLLAMRASQKAYFAKRKASPTDPATAEYRAARASEVRADAAIAAALNRERQPSLFDADG